MRYKNEWFLQYSIKPFITEESTGAMREGMNRQRLLLSTVIALLLTFTTSITIFIGAVQAQEGKWKPIVDPENLRKFVSGGKAEIELKPGVVARGSYFEDGTATLEAWGERFQRTWEVRGDDQVCYSSIKETNCFTFEQNQGVAGEYRARNVISGEQYLFWVTGEDSQTFTRESVSGDKGSLALPSAAEIAAELANPNTTMGTMNFFYDYTQYQGAISGSDSSNSSRLTFQPALPYPLTDSANFFFRPLFPLVLKQDVPATDGFEDKDFEFGDITYDMAVFNSGSNGLVYGGGVAGLIPSATDDALGLNQWLLGPEVLLAVAKPWGVLGIIASHQWSIAGDDDFDTSLTGGQYFYSLNLQNGWTFGAGPTFSYNHKADSGNEWTIPIGVGVSKTKFIGGRPWRFGLQYWYFVESPDDFGPQHAIRLQIAPVVKLPW